jgi:hypothetical protein
VPAVNLLPEGGTEAMVRGEQLSVPVTVNGTVVPVGAVALTVMFARDETKQFSKNGDISRHGE